MQYQALYRKYRPQRFDEVVGQDHVTTTLAREVIEDKVAHAYLLAGPRGTGKTTTARLLAKSLNCPNRDGAGEPCNDCPSCEGITDGSSLDVIELDAASNNKVEDVREIRVNASTVASAEGSHRVYILDEAHMLTRAAGNALLKVLEEPPDRVIFVLATTEPYKLLDTIRSRSQRFDFHPVATETLIDYLQTISEREGFTADRGALEAVTSHSGGSVRDAMSLLEQVAALGAGTVTSTGVSKALGLADHEVYAEMVTIVADGNAPGALELVARLAGSGTDLRRFVGDAIGHFRGIFLAQYSSNIEDVVDVSMETISEWRQQAKVLDAPTVLRVIDELSDALMKLREGREERLVLEIAMIRLTRPETVPSLEGVNARIDRIERSIAQGAVASQPAQATAPTQPEPKKPEGPADRPFESTPTPAESSKVEASTSEPAKPPPSESTAPTPKAPEPTASNGADISIEDFKRAWPAIMADIRNEIGPRRQAYLREAAPTEAEGSTVVFELASHLHFHLEHLKSDDVVAKAITQAATRHLGTGVNVRFRAADAAEPAEAEPATVPDKDDLISAEDDESVDPVNTVVDVLGGEIVEE